MSSRNLKSVEGTVFVIWLTYRRGIRGTGARVVSGKLTTIYKLTKSMEYIILVHYKQEDTDGIK